MKQNLLQLFSSITFTQHFWYCCPKEEPRGCCDMQHIHHFPERENWLVQGDLLAKSEKAKLPRAQSAADVTLPTLAGLLSSPEAQQGAVLTHSSQSPWYFPSHTELPGWEQRLPTHIPSTEGDLRLNRGLKMHKKEQGCTNQCSQADPSPQSPSRLVVASCPQDQAVQTPAVLAQDRALPVPSMAPGTWVTQQLTARGPPTLLPAHLLLKDYFKLTQVYFQITLFSMTKEVTTSKYGALICEVL